MTRPAAIQADFVDTRRIRSRKVLELRFEVPLEHEPHVHEVLGYPMPDSNVPVGIARLRTDRDAPPPAEKPRKRWDELSRAQQAGIRCNDPDFMHFLSRGRGWVCWNEEDAAHAVRNECGPIKSRAELDTDPDAATRWDALDAEFQAWSGRVAEERS